MNSVLELGGTGGPRQIAQTQGKKKKTVHLCSVLQGLHGSRDG